jgi:ribonuclease HI
MASQKYYVVWVGKQPGVYASWADCQKQVNKHADAKFKSYPTKSEAERAYQEGWQKHWGSGASAGKASGQSSAKRLPSKADAAANAVPEIDYDSISVDVGTSGNPGPVEYKGVDTQTGAVLFERGPISKGTNNLGEFLAIVHGLKYLQELGSGKTVYSDSANALKWVRQKAVASTLVRDSSTAQIWKLVDEAVEWLKTNRYDNKVLKWETKLWGEIKADYGRK